MLRGPVPHYAVPESASRWPVAALRLSVGPLALAGFFLPWTHGIGPLASTDFTGFRLFGFAGRLQALDLTPAQDGVLWLFRLLILGVAIAALWHTLLAPAHRRHRAYALSGWYLAAFGAVAALLGLLRAGVTTPPLGLALLVVSATLFAALELTRSRPVQLPVAGGQLPESHIAAESPTEH